MEQKRGPKMHSRALENNWQKSWKILRTPTLEVVAATTNLRYELETGTIVISAAQR